MLKKTAVALVLFLVLIFGLVIFDQLDSDGYIPHEQTVDVLMTNDWLVGENRVCWSQMELDKKGQYTGKMVALYCPVEGRDDERHNMAVKFWGRIDPKNLDGKEVPIATNWKCTRHSDGWICKAT